MRNKKPDTSRLKIKVPEEVLKPSNFDIPNYDCMFVKQQDDGSIVALYRSIDIDNYHWLVVRGYESDYFTSLADAKAFCKHKHYEI